MSAHIRSSSAPEVIAMYEPKEKPAIFVPAHAPDDPGVPQAESDEGPSPLERLRAAQIR